MKSPIFTSTPKKNTEINAKFHDDFYDDDGFTPDIFATGTQSISEGKFKVNSF